MSKCQNCDRYQRCPLCQDLHQMEGVLSSLPRSQRRQTMDSIMERFAEPSYCAMDAGFVAASW